MRTRLQLLGHPLFTGSVALLAVNDHFLKESFPGPLTGKLSDFTGLFIVAVIGGLLVNRVRPALVTVGLGFVAIKLSATATYLVAPVLGGVTRQDPTDLVALVVLWPASTFLVRQEVPEGPSLARVFVALAGGGVAMLSIGATSCLESRPHVVEAFSVDGDTVYAEIPRNPSNPGARLKDVRWALSEDGGESWTVADKPPEDSVDRQDKDCTTSGNCFRVVPGKRIDTQSNGEWLPAFAFSEEEFRRLHQRNRDCGEVPPAEDLYRSLTVVRVGGEDHVLVAMGTQGVLHLGPGGEWEREGVLDLEPSPLYGPSWLNYGGLAPFVLALSSPLFALLGFAFRHRIEGLWAMGFSLACALLLFAVVVMLVFGDADYAISGAVIGGLSLAVFVLSVLTVVKGWNLPRGRWRRKAPTDSPS